MFTVEYGDGEHIAVGLHGWGGDHQTFAPMVPLLPSDWRLIAVDLPGYGQTPAVWPCSIEQIAEQIAALLEQQTRPVVLVGSCSGAVLALETALLVPERVARIVALDLFAFMPWYFRFFTHEPIGAIAFSLTFESAIGRAVVNAALRNRRTDRSNLTASFDGKDGKIVRSYLKALAALPGPQRYKAVPTPVDLVWGERTFSAVRSSVPIWRQYLRIRRAQCIPNAGHLLLDEAPQLVAPIVFGDQQ
jgi:pimeloyl-ACP methyl ester carboxylesterase